MNMMIIKRKVFETLSALFISALFISCGNLFSNVEEAAPEVIYSEVRFVANLQFNPSSAMPEELSKLVSNSDSSSYNASSRSAVPGLNIGPDENNTMEYYVIATCSGQTTQQEQGNSSTMELKLTAGHTWHIECGISDKTKKDSNGKPIVYLSAETDIPVTSSEPVITKNFILKPSTEGEGTIELPISVSSNAVEIGRTLILCPELIEKLQFTVSTNSLNLHTKENETIPSGAYDVQLKFFNAQETLVYVSNQTINVYDNMTTNKWLPDGEAINAYGEFRVTDDLVQSFMDTTIYVGVIPELATNQNVKVDANNMGTAYSPYANLQNAIDKIRTCGNGKDYRIYVSGEFEGATIISEGNSGDSLKLSEHAKSITIEGYNGLDNNGNPQDKILGDSINTSAGNKATITIGTQIPITIQNILLTKKDNISGFTRGIYLESGADVTLGSGTVISDFTAGTEYNGERGGGVNVQSGARLTLKGATIKNNKAYLGGGIYIEGDGEEEKEINISKAQITNNHALYGGGISVENAKVTITNTTISSNKADLSIYYDGGGGLTLWENANVTLGTGCLVQDNTARFGGGVDVIGATLTLDGGQIIGNHAVKEREGSTDGCGGGIYFTETSCTINIYRGLISKNTAENFGGAIYFNGDEIEDEASHLLYITGGTIEKNQASKGGAIYIYPTAENNEIYFTFDLGGSAFIPYGVDGTTGSGKNDIFFDGPNNQSYASIVLLSELTKHSKTNPIALRINEENAKRGIPSITASTSLENQTEKFMLYSEDWELKLSSDKNSINLDAPIYVKQGGTTAPDTADGTKTKPYDSIKVACKNGMSSSSLDYTIKILGNLEDNQQLVTGLNTISAKSITIMGADGLDDKGVPKNAIIGNSDTYASTLNLNYAVPVIIKELKITGGNNTSPGTDSAGTGGGINSKATTLTLSNGTLITGNAAKQGGGIYQIGGKLVIEDGAIISGNTAVGFYNGSFNVLTGGGGVAVANNAILVMSGGKISGNIIDSAERLVMGGGVVCLGSSKIFIYKNAVIGGIDATDPKTPTSVDSALAVGGNVACGTYYSETDAIYENTGAGIAVVKGTVYLGYKPDSSNDSVAVSDEEKLSGGVLGNYSSNDLGVGFDYGRGGGIYLKDNFCKLYIANGNVSYNYAYGGGGGVYANGNSVFELSGGTLQGNTSKTGSGEGGGVYNAGSFTMSGGEISGCKAWCGGGVYNVKTFVMSDGKIYGNEAGNHGGGVWTSEEGSTFAMFNKAIIGGVSDKPNKASIGGGLTVAVGGEAYIGYKTDCTTIDSNFDGGFSYNQSTTAGLTGGAIELLNNAKNPICKIASGYIKNNTGLTGKGSGIMVDASDDGTKSSRLELKGYAYIAPDNFIKLDKGTSIRITGTLTPTTSGNSNGTAATYTATITPYRYQTGDTVLTSETENLISGNFEKFTLTPNDTTPWFVRSDGTIGESLYYGSKTPNEERQIGDILYKDGSADPYNVASLGSVKKNAAVAVIFYVGSSGDELGERTLGMAITKNYKWTINFAKEGSPCYERRIATNEIDGRENWRLIKEADPTGTANANENYHVFYLCDTYGVKYQGDPDGWYLPAIKEVKAIFPLNNAVRTALGKTGGQNFDNYGAPSSTQSSEDCTYMLGVWSSGDNDTTMLPNDQRFTIIREF